jgi:beta-N-acetylhexosaminidase
LVAFSTQLKISFMPPALAARLILIAAVVSCLWAGAAQAQYYDDRPRGYPLPRDYGPYDDVLPEDLDEDYEEDVAPRAREDARRRRYPDDHWYYGRNVKPPSRPRDPSDERQALPREPSSKREAPAPSVVRKAQPELTKSPPPLPEKRGGRSPNPSAIAVKQSPPPPSDAAAQPPPASQGAPAEATAVAKPQAVTATIPSIRPDEAPAETTQRTQKINAAAKTGQEPSQIAEAPPAPRVADAPSQPAEAPPPPADQLTKMIGQMLFVGFQGADPDETWPKRLAGQISAGYVGGVYFGSHNVRSPEQTRRLTSALKAVRTEHTLLVAVDQEGGEAQPLSQDKGFLAHPAASDVGAANDPLKANEAYAALAKELRATGFNLNFAPVADLSRAANVKGGRSYGANPLAVTAFVKAFAVAHRDAGVLTALKHFPGGATADSASTPLNDTAWSEEDLDPYRSLGENKFVDIVMVGHARNARFSGLQGAPASLSRDAVQMLLRGALGYEGVTITSDLEMQEISAYSFEERLILAIEAGNDMLLLANAQTPQPALPELAINAIRKAVETGRLSRERIRTSYDRILQLKRNLTRMQKNIQASNAPPVRPAN